MSKQAVNDVAPTVRQRWLPWHRRIGVVAALFVLVIASTGLLLNHSDDLKLDERFVQSRWLLNWYGVQAPASAVQVFEVNGVWVAHRGETLFAQGEARVHCADLRSVQREGHDVLAVCGSGGWLLDAQGDVLEPWPSTRPLPALAPERHRRPALELPAEQRSKMESQPDEDHSIHWERVLLDLHSGRLFGAAGVWLFDVAALLFIFLALSGVFVWSSKACSGRRKSS